MNSDHRPDIVDTRMIFRVYAGLALLAGLLLIVGSPPWLTTTLVSDPAVRPSFMRLLGALIVAAGCVATGFAQIEDPRNRHHALRWFANAHLVLLTALLIAAVYHGGPDAWDLSLPTLAGTTLLLYYFWQTGDGHRAGESVGLIDLFGRQKPSPEEMRSAYEDRIRAAASQEERHRLARDLHDSIKQQIFAMQTAAATAQTRFDSDPAGAKEALDRLRESGREAMTEMEAMLDNLRSAPLENVGLVEALKKQGEALQFRTGAHVSFEIGSLPHGERLAPAAQQAIFRVALEALANVGRHARATRVGVSLTSDTGRVVLRIEDDGAGFVPGAGAAGYVRKDADPEVLLAAVRAVARGKTYIDPTVARQVMEVSSHIDDLTPRELEVLRRLALGHTNREIGAELFIGEETVKTHISKVLAKLQVENRAQAIVQALKRGLVAIEELQ
jgi:signal transduction histidine kinase/DNA-binding CsgD family transcriptional regulator